MGNTAGASNINEESQIQAQQWLVHGRSPIEFVQKQWNKCFNRRQQQIQNEKDLSAIFLLYPIIQDPKGGILVIIEILTFVNEILFLIQLQLSSDFDRLHPDATRKFYLRFPLLHQKLQNHLEKAGIHKVHGEKYKQYIETTHGEYKNYLLCTFLPVIIPTNYRIKGKWRPSLKESQMSLILEVSYILNGIF